MQYSIVLLAAAVGLVSAAGNATGIVTQIGDGQIQAPPSAPPAQANGAAALGVSAAAAGVVAAAAMLI